jgi:hypothetical protein
MRIVHIHDGLEDSQAALVGRVRRHLVRVEWRDCLAGRDMDPPPADLALVETDVVDLAAVSPLLSGKVPALLATSPPEAEPRAAGAMARGLKRAKLGFGLLATPSFHPGLAGLFGLAQSGVLGRVVEISLRRAGPWKPFLLGGPRGKGEGGGNWWDRQVLRACLGMDTGGGDGVREDKRFCDKLTKGFPNRRDRNHSSPVSGAAWLRESRRAARRLQKAERGYVMVVIGSWKSGATRNLTCGM